MISTAKLPEADNIFAETLDAVINKSKKLWLTFLTLKGNSITQFQSHPRVVKAKELVVQFGEKLKSGDITLEDVETRLNIQAGKPSPATRGLLGEYLEAVGVSGSGKLLDKVAAVFTLHQDNVGAIRSFYRKFCKTVPNSSPWITPIIENLNTFTNKTVKAKDVIGAYLLQHNVVSKIFQTICQRHVAAGTWTNDGVNNLTESNRVARKCEEEFRTLMKDILKTGNSGYDKTTVKAFHVYWKGITRDQSRIEFDLAEKNGINIPGPLREMISRCCGLKTLIEQFKTLAAVVKTVKNVGGDVYEKAVGDFGNDGISIKDLSDQVKKCEEMVVVVKQQNFWKVPEALASEASVELVKFLIDDLKDYDIKNLLHEEQFDRSDITSANVGNLKEVIRMVKAVLDAPANSFLAVLVKEVEDKGEDLANKVNACAGCVNGFKRLLKAFADRGGVTAETITGLLNNSTLSIAVKDGLVNCALTKKSDKEPTTTVHGMEELLDLQSRCLLMMNNATSQPTAGPGPQSPPVDSNEILKKFVDNIYILTKLKETLDDLHTLGHSSFTNYKVEGIKFPNDLEAHNKKFFDQRENRIVELEKGRQAHYPLTFYLANQLSTLFSYFSTGKPSPEVLSLLRLMNPSLLNAPQRQPMAGTNEIELIGQELSTFFPTSTLFFPISFTPSPLFLPFVLLCYIPGIPTSPRPLSTSMALFRLSSPPPPPPPSLRPSLLPSLLPPLSTCTCLLRPLSLRRSLTAPLVAAPLPLPLSPPSYSPLLESLCPGRH